MRGALRALEKRKQYYIPGWRNYLVTMLVRIGSRQRVVKESMKYFRPGHSSAAPRQRKLSAPQAKPSPAENRL